MITANELRIGNWVDTPDGFREVVRFDTHFITIKTYPKEISPSAAVWNFKFDEYNPIQLTPEILEKCGFVDYAKNGFGLRLYLNQSDELFYGIQDCELRYQTRGSGFTRDFKIKYLHQLQNLVFALTGQELEVKL